MAATQVAAQVTTKRVYNLMSSGQALMRSVYYSRQTSSSFLWKKQREIFSAVGSASRRFATGMPEASQRTEENPEASGSSAPPAVDSDTKAYGTMQEDAHKVAKDSHEEYNKKDDEPESLESTGYDISKVSKPAGDE